MSNNTDAGDFHLPTVIHLLNTVIIVVVLLKTFLIRLNRTKNQNLILQNCIFWKYLYLNI